MYKNINYEYYGFKDEENEEMVFEEKEFEQRKLRESLDEWIKKNKSLIQTKLKGIKEPSQEDIFKLIDEDNIQIFKARHETSKFF